MNAPYASGFADVVIVKCENSCLRDGQELKKGRVRRLWEWGRMIYRVTAFSYGAFSVYENPWLVRALLAALWTACRMLLRAGTGLPI